MTPFVHAYGKVPRSNHIQWSIRNRQLHAVLWKSTAGSSVFNWVQSFSSGKETAQVAVHKWYLSTPEEWYCGAIWKLTDGFPWLISQNPWRMVLWSHLEAHRRLSISDISKPLKNGSVEPSGSSQANVHEWYLITPEEWVLLSHSEAHRQLSISGISKSLKNGSLEPSGSSQAGVHEWYLITPEDWILWSHPKAHRQLSMSDISSSLKNGFFGAIRKLTGSCPWVISHHPQRMGSLEPPGSSQATVHVWYLKTPEEWFFGSIRKLPRRWQRCGRGDMLSYWLFSIHSKDNKIAANEVSQGHFRTPRILLVVFE